MMFARAKQVCDAAPISAPSIISMTSTLDSFPAVGFFILKVSRLVGPLRHSWQQRPRDAPLARAFFSL